MELYGQEKQFDKAIEYARQWIKEAAGSDMPKFILLRVLEKGKAYDKSLKLLDEWIGKGQDESVTIYRHYKVSILGHAGKFQEVIDYVSKWLAKSPQELEPRRTLVSVLARDQKYDQAISQLETWMKQLTAAAATSRPASRPASKPASEPASSPASKPASGPASSPASKPASGPASSPASKPAAAVDNKKTQETLQWCRQTIVRLLAMQGKYTAAMARAEAFLRLDEKDTELLSVMSSCLSSMGKDREARIVLEKALKIKPDDPGLNNNLGYLYTEQGIKLDEAERMIRKALAEKNVAAFMDSLGWVLYKRGRFKEAAAVFKKTLEMIARDGQDHSVIHDHIGDTHYRQGRVEEALEQWKQAVKIAQEDKIKTTETKHILSATPDKIKAVQAGKEPKVSPLGKDVKDKKSP
jgi:tetratricopeptide (TPR) repeat protein